LQTSLTRENGKCDDLSLISAAASYGLSEYGLPVFFVSARNREIIALARSDLAVYNTLKRPHAWLNLTFNFVSRLSVAAWNCRCGVLMRTFTVTMYLLFLAVSADAQTSQLCIYGNVGKAAKISETIESVVPTPKEQLFAFWVTVSAYPECKRIKIIGMGRAPFECQIGSRVEASGTLKASKLDTDPPRYAFYVIAKTIHCISSRQ
jgi:hypothetical protein